MKLAIVIMAVMAAASAQTGPFNPFNQGQYKPYQQQYNPFQQQYNPYRKQYSTPAPYRPYTSTTAAPFVSFAPSTVAPPTPTAVPLPVVSKNYNYAEPKNAEIVKSENEIFPDGSFRNYIETSNGIAAQAEGTPRDFGGNPPVIADVVQGSFSWISPEGQPIAISYIADENGYQPSGDSLPVPPPIPPQIARALEYLARNAPAQ